MNLVRIPRRLLSWLLLLPLSLVLMLLAGGGFLLSTETGLNSLLALAERVLPGQLSYTRISGRLFGPLQVENLRYADGPLRVALARGELDWQPARLFEQTLTISRLHLTGLELDLPPDQDTPPSTEAFTLPDIALPLAIQIQDLQAQALRIQPAGAAPIIIDRVMLKARTAADALRIEAFELYSPLGDARLNGQLTPRADYPLQAHLDWRAPTPAYGDFRGQGELRGALGGQLELSQTVNGAATLELRATLRELLNSKPVWSVQAKVQVDDLQPFVAELAGRPLSAQVDAQGVLARFEGRGQISTTLPELGPATLRVAAAGDEQALRLSELKLTATNRPLTLDAQGELQLAELRFNASGQWRALVWPLQGPAQVESPQGEFTAKGTAQDYQFQLAADLQGPQIPKGRWALQGQGSDQALRGVTLNGQTLEGRIEATVDAAWAPAVSWKAALSGSGLNPGAQWKDVPGKLNLRLKSDGGLDKGVLRVNLLLEELAGTLSGQMLNGNADVSLRDQDLTIRALRLNAGAARLDAQGTLAQRWDLRWTVDAPQLKTLLPGLSGSVASSGTLSGSREQPRLAATFALRDLRQGATQVQRLQGETDIVVGKGERSRLKLSGEGLLLGGQRWQSLRLDGDGTPEAHQVQAELAGAAGRFALALTGQLQQPALNWQGRITQLSARDTVVGAWSLDKTVAVQAAADKARLDPACLISAPTRLCLQGQWNGPRGFDARVQLSNLTPERFKAFLPPELKLDTRIDAEASASSGPGGAPQGKLDLKIAPGNLNMVAQGHSLRFNLNGGSLRVEGNSRTANAQARLDLAQTGQLQASAQLQDPLGSARINGTLDAAITDLAIVSLFAPQVEKVSGQLRATINASGTLPKLVLRGNVRLENAALSVPEAGLHLRDVQFSADSNGQGPLQLSGSVRSKPGQMQLDGTLDPLQRQLRLTIKGENFQALDTADLRIQISPDLKLEADPGQIRVDGQVTVPKAFLRPGGGRPGTVSNSRDMVVVNGSDGAALPPKPAEVAISARVRAVLGEDVQLETPVFKGQLKGSLLVEETPQLAPRGSGTIEVAAGNYRIYGEEIQIQRGQVLFSNSSLDNPGLDLRVARQVNSDLSDSTTVGAQVRGTLKQPRLTLFSEPSMPDASILSYLVLGRAPGGGGEAAMLFKASSALGLGGNALAGGLGSSLGLDTMQFDSGSSSGSGNSNSNSAGASLTLGKYLSPDLYVGYGVGLLDAVNAFKIKYRLSKRLVFESSTSALGTGADLTYTLEY